MPQTRFVFHSIAVSNLRLLTAFPPADQHRSQDQRPDQAERGGAHTGLLRRRPEDRLQPYGEGLVPALPEVRHLPPLAGLHLKVGDVKRLNMSLGWRRRGNATETLRMRNEETVFKEKNAGDF